jgi:hypothetical protein
MFKKSLLVFTFICCSTSFGQHKIVDSLLQHINNKEAYILLVNTMSPRMNSEAGEQIIQIGKKATPELLQILDSQEKGIIAHFILSEIWKETWNEQICCNIMYSGAIEIFTINGLKIYIDNNVLYSNEIDLKNNKIHWEKIVTS